MRQLKHIQLMRSPSIMSLYREALLARGSKTSNPQLPKTKITLRDIKADINATNRYRKLCGFPLGDNKLPITFPHILAFPLHLKLMLLKGFPFGLMGMIHVRNEITQYRAIKTHETMDVRCFFSGLLKTSKGYEVDITTEVYISGEKVWESISKNLVRRKTDVPSRLKQQETALDPDKIIKEVWYLPSSLGRRYSRISGDSNPIHLYRASAKVFGFKGHIAHGMWTKARIASALYNQLGSEACKITVDFKLPIFLPSTIQLKYILNKDKIEFEVREESGIKPHLKGEITALSPPKL